MAPAYQSLAQVIHQFPQRGEQVALKFFNGFRIQSMSYRAFYENIVRCTALFADHQLQAGDRLMIWAPNSPAWAIAYCACALSGVILVPIDARHTAGFVESIQQQTQAKAIVHSQLRDCRFLGIQTIEAESLLDRLADYPATEPPGEIDADAPFQIIYTSGTTGSPKGVMLTQRNQAANLSDILSRVPVDDSYHLLSVLPLSHALEQLGGFWTPMAAGGSITYLQVLKPSALMEIFQRNHITAMIVVPRLLDLLKQRIENRLNDKRLGGYLALGQWMAPVLPRLLRKMYFYPVHRQFDLGFHLFVCGGSALPLEVERFWKGLGFTLFKGYGLTETSPVVSVEDYQHQRLGSVGLPLPQVEIKLGQDHELLVRGPSVFPGYYQNPEATEQSFQAGWYRTGDVCEIDPDGFVFIRGRIKDVIVTADGINVYPEDIEPVINRIEGVQEACVIGMGDDEHEVHAVLLLDSPEVNAAACISEANRQLAPEQQIEQWHIWPEPEFPKTTTLKIKKNEVRKRLQDQQDGQKQSAIEGTKLMQIIADLNNIPIEEIGPESTLGPGLGLSSIDRIELITRLETEFRLDIAEDQVTPETTVADLESILQARGTGRVQIPIRRWTLSKPIHYLRAGFEETVMRAILATFCRLHLRGAEHLEGLAGPVMIVANHTSHVDTPLIKQIFPKEIGRKLCPAAWKEYFDAHDRPLPIKIGKWLAWQYATILVNIFPLPQDMTARQSMIYAAELIDKGWSVLIFPEGSRTTTGDLLEFRDGVGFLARNLNVPLVPVAIYGGEKILRAGHAFPRRGDICLNIGKPWQPGNHSVDEIKERLRDEMESLYQQAKDLC